MTDIATIQQQFSDGGGGCIAFLEDKVCVPVYPEGSTIAQWIPLKSLPTETNPETGKSYKTMWDEHKKILLQLLRMENGNFLYWLLILCWPRGEGASLLVCLIILWKFICFPQQKFLLAGDSKDQVKFLHFDIIKNIILNSPKVIDIVGQDNVLQESVWLQDKHGNDTSVLRPASAFSDMSFVTGYAFSGMSSKNTKLFTQLDGSARSVQNAFGLIDSTVSAKTHLLHQLFEASKHDPTLFFSYRSITNGDLADYWHPHVSEKQLQLYKAKFPPGDFERYFLNRWDWENAKNNYRKGGTMTTDVATVQQEKALTLRKHLFSDAVVGRLNDVAKGLLDVDRLVRLVYAAAMKNPRLLECTIESILGAMLQCGQYGVEPVLGRAHLVPYRNNKKPGKPYECQFQLGYQGMIDLAERTGKIETVVAHVIYSNDTHEVQYGLNENLIHIPMMDGDRGNPIGAYTVWTRTTGVKKFTFMPAGDIFKIRDKSPAYRNAVKYNDKNSPWIAWESEMMKKTVIKRHSKLEPAAINFMPAVEQDNLVEAGELTGVFEFQDKVTGGTATALTDGSIKDKFEEKLPRQVDTELMTTFLKKTAEANKQTINEVMGNAINNFETFWSFWVKWETAQGQKKQLQEGQNDAEMLHKIKECKTKGFTAILTEIWEDLPNMSAEVQTEVVSKYKRLFRESYEPGTKPTFGEATEPTAGDALIIICPENGKHPGGQVDVETFCKVKCDMKDNCNEWQQAGLPNL